MKIKLFIISFLCLTNFFLHAQTPVNDDPCGAILLPDVTSTCNYQLFTTTNATATPTAIVAAPSSCNIGAGNTLGNASGFYAGGDVWFQVIVPANGHLVIAGNPVGGTVITGGAVALYSGSCNGTLTQIACNDYYRLSTTTSNDMGFINATGLLPGEILYIRYWDEANNTRGSFELCVSTPSNDNCMEALFICDLNGYNGTTSRAYTADRPGNMCDHNNGTNPCTLFPDNPAIIGANGYATIDNNSWLTFVAASTQATLNIVVSDCWKASSTYNGIQLRGYGGTDCANFFAVSPMLDNVEVSGTITLGGNGYPNLVPGQKYYLMIDGFGGDICNYTIKANSGVLVTEIVASPDDTICTNNNTITLTAVTPQNTGGQTFTWSSTPAGNYPTTKIINVSPTVTTTYTCVVTGVCGATQTLTEVVVVNTPITGDLNATSTPICSNESATLNATLVNYSTVNWTGGTGTFIPNRNTLNPTYTPSTTEINAGFVNLTLKAAAANGCSNFNKTTRIDIQKEITVDATVASNNICGSSSIAINGTVAGAVTTGTWTGGTGTFIPNRNVLNPSYTPSAAEASAGIVTLTISNTPTVGACANKSKDLTFNLYQQPSVTIDGTATKELCEGEWIMLSGTLATGTTGTWSTNGNGTFMPANSINTRYTPGTSDIANGSVLLTFTTNDPVGPCNSATATNTLVIYKGATVDANVASSTMCAGGNVSLLGTFGGSANQASWTGGTGAFNPNRNTVNAVYTPSAAENTAGQVTLTLTTNDPAGTCGSIAEDVTITITDQASVTIDGPAEKEICEGTTKLLRADREGSADDGVWTTAGTGLFFPATTPITTYTPSQADIDAGIVILTYTTDDPVGPCNSASASCTLRIYKAPIVNAGLDQTICEGTTATLNGTIGGGVGSASWSGYSGILSPNVFTLNASYLPSATEIANGSAILVLTTEDPVGPCDAATDALNVIIQPKANVVINPSTATPICSNDLILYEASITGGVITGTWSSPGNGIFSPNNTNLNGAYRPSVVDVANNSATLILISADPAGICPADTDKVNVPIFTNPTANAGQPQTICAGSNVSLSGTITGVNGGNWTTAGTGTFSNVNSLTPIYTPSSLDVNNGSVILTLNTDDPTGPCGVISSSVTITILLTPPLPSVTANPDLEICANESITLNASPVSQNYEWYDQPVAGTLLSSNDSYTTPILQQNTTYYVRSVLGTCTSVRIPVTVTVNPLPPTPTMTAGDASMCEGDSVLISANVNLAGITITWWDAATNGNQIGTGNDMWVDPTTTTTYWAEGISTAGCMSNNRISTTITVNPNPDIAITTNFPDNTIIQGQILEVTAAPTGFAKYDFYINNVLVQSGTSNLYQTNTIQDGQVIHVIATDANGCSSANGLGGADDSIKITVRPFPNAFTPNGNGINEKYLKGFDLTIINRWGQELYKGLDGWDGLYNGNAVSSGTYYYIVNVAGINGNPPTPLNGAVTLLK